MSILCVIFVHLVFYFVSKIKRTTSLYTNLVDNNNNNNNSWLLLEKNTIYYYYLTKLLKKDSYIETITKISFL